MIQLIVLLIVIAVLAWAVMNYVPMQPPLDKLVMFVFVLVALLVVLSAFGIVSAPALR